MNRNVLFMVGYREQIDFLTFSTVCTFWATLTKMCRHISWAISCAVILFQIKFVLKAFFTFFSAYYMQFLLLSFFWWCFALWVVPLKSVRAIKDQVIIQYQYVVSSTRKPSDCAMGPFAPQALEISQWWGGHKYGCCCSLDQIPCYLVWTDKSVDGTKASVSKFPVNKQLASLRVLSSESSSWTCSSPCTTAIATESWRGKRVKEPSLSPYANMQGILGQEWYVRSAVGKRDSCLFFILPQSTIYLNIYMISC